MTEPQPGTRYEENGNIYELVDAATLSADQKVAAFMRYFAHDVKFYRCVGPGEIWHDERDLLAMEPDRMKPIETSLPRERGPRGINGSWSVPRGPPSNVISGRWVAGCGNPWSAPIGVKGKTEPVSNSKGCKLRPVMSPEERARLIRAAQNKDGKALDGGRQAPAIAFYEHCMAGFMDDMTSLAGRLKAKHHARMRELVADIHRKADLILTALDGKPPDAWPGRDKEE